EKKLSKLTAKSLTGGPLKGLLFNDPARFIDDLRKQLRMTSTMYAFSAAVNAPRRNEKQLKQTLGAFTDAADKWQQKHGYSNHWYWPQMIEALRKLDNETINATLNTLTWLSDEGDTPFDKVKNGLARL